nr:sucrose-6-phosphate hydrolase [Geomicrobium sp. JCM 19039]
MEWTKEERYRPYSAMSKTEESRLLHVVDHAPWRQHYHIQPPTGLLNDPNGFCFYNGQYHLFYQWFPYGAVHGLKHWYHTTSTNLVLWQGQGVAIEPEESFESHGAYSGSGIVVDEQLYLLYTGNERDSNWERTPNQCLAIMKQTAASKNYLRPLSKVRRQATLNTCATQKYGKKMISITLSSVHNVKTSPGARCCTPLLIS